MDTSTAVEVTSAADGASKPPDTLASSEPVMHTLQPVMAAEQLGVMQPPASLPLMVPPYQMVVMPQGVAQIGSPSIQQGSPATQDSSSRSGTPASQPLAVLSQGLTPQMQAEQQAQLLQAMAAAQLQHQDNGAVTRSPVPQGSAGSQGSPAPPTPGSMGSPMPIGDGLQQLPLQIAGGQVASIPVNMAGLGFQPQVVDHGVREPSKEVKIDMKPPKKPLTPYMRFSKSIWQQVKAANQGMSVCEIGATIGRMWRELGDADKQLYNEEFTQAKVKYEEELQAYLKMTGLQASDLVKTKKKKDSKKGANKTATTPAQIPAQQLVTAAANPGTVSVNGPVTIPFQAGTAVSGATLAQVGALPHFSQVWTGQQQYAIAPGFTNGEGGGGEVQQVAVGADGTVTTSGTVIYSQLPSGHIVTAVQTSLPQTTQVTSSEGSVSAPAETEGGQWQWQQQKEAEASTPAPTDILSQAAAVSSISPAVSQANNSEPVKEEGEKEAPTSAAQYPSAHTLYNSYGYNPWTAYTTETGGSKPEGVGKPVISEREKSLETEVSHLKSALTEKTKEVKKLEQELHKAYDIIERLHQQHLAAGTQIVASSPAATDPPTPHSVGPALVSSSSGEVAGSDFDAEPH